MCVPTADVRPWWTSDDGVMDCLKDLVDATLAVLDPTAPAAVVAGRKAYAGSLFTQLADVTDAIVDGTRSLRLAVRL